MSQPEISESQANNSVPEGSRGASPKKGGRDAHVAITL